MKSASKLILLGFISTAGLCSFAGQSAEASITQCTSGRLLGRYALKSQLNGKYVRAGIGSQSYVGAKSNRIGGNNSWETFDIYDLGNRSGLNGGTYALRSTQDPNRWVSVNNSKKLQLMGGCNSRTRNRLFVANKVGNTLQLQSLANQQWVIQRSNNMLNANAPTAGGNVPRALQFAMVRQAAPTPSDPTPIPQPQRINGWFKGNRSGYYTTQTSGTSFQMKAFTNSGKLLNRFKGTISGNRVNGTWRNYCNNRSGDATLLYQNGQLRRIAGNTANTRWTPIQRPSIQLESQPSCNTTARINGWFKGNRSGYYTTQTSGTSFQMKAFTNSGKLLNRFKGTISGNRVNGTWRNYCNNRSGDATLLYQNGQLRRIAGNTANTRWTPIQRPSIQLESQPSCP